MCEHLKVTIIHIYLDFTEMICLSKFDVLIDLYKDVPKTNILYILDMFGPQNLKILHELLNKHKSTILGKIQEMVDDSQIEIDPATTAKKKGKYYTLTKKMRAILHNDEQIIITSNSSESTELSKTELKKRFANMIRALGFQAHLISSLSAQFIEKSYGKEEESSKAPLKISRMIVGSCELGLNTREDFAEVMGIYDEFRQKLRKFDISKRKNAKNTMLMITLGGTKEDIGPSNS